MAETKIFFLIYWGRGTFIGPGPVAQLVGASSYTPKDCKFEFQSEHISRLQVQSPVRAHMGHNQSVSFLHSPPFPSLSLSLCV